MKLNENYRIKDINDDLLKLQMPVNNNCILENNRLILNILTNLKELNKDMYTKYKLKVGLVRSDNK